MNYRPYPDVDRALAQLERGRVFQPTSSLFVGLAASVMASSNFQAGMNRLVMQARRAGKSAITAGIVDQAVKAGEHVHVAGRDGVRCAGGDAACPLSRIERGDQVVVHHGGDSSRYEVTDIPARDPGSGQPTAFQLALRRVADSMPSSGAFAANATAFSQAIAGAAAQEDARARAEAAGPPHCPGCGHDQHAPGVECEAGVDHGLKRWHRCLCLATPGASRACPPQMDCQGGTLGFSDVWHLRQGRSLRGMNGETITPDVLAEPQPIVLARVVRTCTAVPSQWNAWTTEGQYLYLRYRSGIGTVDAYDTEDSKQWTRIPDGAVARFDTGDRTDGEMALVEFCECAGLQLTDDAEVIGE